MGAFDDLIAPQTPQQPQLSPSGGGAFDDLIQAQQQEQQEPPERPSGPAAVFDPQSWRERPLETFAQSVAMPFTAPQAAAEQIEARGGRLGAFVGNARDAMSFGFADELAGVQGGLAADLSGRDFATIYRQRVNDARSRLEQARREYPLSSLGGSLVGSMALGAPATALTRMAPGGQALLSAAGGRGAGAVGAQMGLGLGTGAGFGAAYGAGAADDGDRLHAAMEGGTSGALFGAFTPPAMQGVVNANPLVRAGTGAALGFGSSFLTGADPVQSTLAGAGVAYGARPLIAGMGGPLLEAWRNPRRAFGNQTGMSLGIPPVGDDAAAAGGSPIIDRSALRSVDRALGRDRIGVGELERRIEGAQTAPLGRRLVDLSDEFSADLDSMANQPGQSYTRALEVAQERAARLPEQIQGELRQLVGVRTSPTQALDEIRAGVVSTSDGYEQVLAQAPRAEVIARRIAPLMQTPEMQPALARRFRVEEGRAQLAQVRGQQPQPRSVLRVEGEDGTVRFELSPNANGRALHEVKTAIDDELSAAVDRRSLSPAGRSEQSLLDDYREEYLSALDDALPGYGEVRAQRGSLYDAERALGLNKDGVSRIGRQILGLRPEEISRRMRETVTPTGRTRPTTPFEQEMIRVGVADEIIQRIDDYISASGDKMRNAGEVLDRVGLQNRLRAVFNETPEAIDAFLNRAIERAQMLRRAASWTGNSASARRLTRAGDRFMSALSEAGLNAATGNPGAAVTGVGRGAVQALMGRAVERQNDAYANALMRSVERASPEDERYMTALLRELRRLEQQRLDQARNATIGGATGAVGGGAYTTDGY